MAARNAPPIERPTRVGERPLSWALVVAVPASFVLASAVITEILAFRLRYNPVLGARLGPLFPPWAWFGWLNAFLQPVQHLTHAAVRVYPPDVYRAFDGFAFVLGAGLLAGMALLGAVAAVTQRSLGTASDLFDSGSHWANAAVARRDGLLGGRAGPIIGGFDDIGGVRAMRYGGELGISYVEPPGGGKSAFLKTNLLVPLRHEDAAAWNDDRRRAHPWGEEPVILASDPKFELFRETSGYQARALGKRVHLLAPLGAGRNLDVSEADLASYNPFWSIRLGSDRGFQDCYFRTLAIVDGEGEGLRDHWDRTALSWGAAVIEKLGFRALATGDYESFSLPGLLDYVSSFASLEALLEHMLNSPDDPAGVFGWQERAADGTVEATFTKPSIAQAAREMLNKDVRERAGVYSTFVTFLAPYRSEILRRFSTRSTFSWSEIANDRERSSIVYLGLDPMDIPKLRPYLRMVVGDAVEELTSGGTVDLGGRSARGNFRPAVVAMDEAAAWRRLAEIEHGSGYFRGYGVYLWLIWQSVAQQKRYYGRDNLLDETMDVQIYGRPKTADGAEAIRKLLGERTELIRKRSMSGGRFSVVAGQAQDSVEMVKLPLLSEKEIMQLDRDRYVAIYNGHNYFLRKWEYYKDATLAARAKLPYVRKTETPRGGEPRFVASVLGALAPPERARWQAYRTSVASLQATMRGRNGRVA